MTTHLSDIEDETEHTFTNTQLSRFQDFIDNLPSAIVRHYNTNTAHLILPNSRYDIIHTKIALYGLWPSKETQISAAIVHNTAPQLHPILT